VKVLLDLPCSESGTVLHRLTATDEDGNTPLHLAALHGHAEVAAWLWMAMEMETPNLERRNKVGKTPLDLGREQGHVAVLLPFRRVFSWLADRRYRGRGAGDKFRLGGHSL